MLQPLLQQPWPFEVAAGHFVQSFANASLDQFFSLITHLGNPALWILLAIFLYWKGEERKAISVASVILFTSALIGGLKESIQRPRPSPQDFRVLVQESGYSFPSGHAATIAGIFGYSWERFKGSAKAFGIIVVLLVMTSRVYLGVHFVGDVIVGAAFGFVIGRILHGIERSFDKINFDQKKILEEAGIMVFVVLALAISILYRPLAFGSGLLGFFVGAFAFKLMNMNSAKLKGTRLLLKELMGFVTLAAIVWIGGFYAIQPETYFLAGAWATLIYPALWEKVAERK